MATLVKTGIKFRKDFRLASWKKTLILILTGLNLAICDGCKRASCQHWMFGEPWLRGFVTFQDWKNKNCTVPGNPIFRLDGLFPFFMTIKRDLIAIEVKKGK